MADPDLIRLLSEGRQAWDAEFARNHQTPPDLSNADLTGYWLVLYDLTGADLRGSDLSGVLMAGVILDRAQLDGANLTGAVLGAAKMRGASLRDAVLTGAELGDARLDGADLTGADLRDANLEGCRLIGANLDGAIVGKNLEMAILLDSNTIWPQLDADATHTFGLRVVSDQRRPNWPTVRILIDGEDILGLEAHKGFDPDKIFAESAPLLPTDPSRRIAVYRCGCGEAGCSVIAPLIVDDGTTIEWRDFRDFTGVYVNPDTDIAPAGGTKLGIPDVHFDADQYRTEVAKAVGDRSWETHARTTARLLRAKLQKASEHFDALGYRVTTVAPYDDGAFSIVMQEVQDGSAVGNTFVRLAHPHHEVDDLATALAEELISTAPNDWDVTNRYSYPARSGRHKDQEF